MQPLSICLVQRLQGAPCVKHLAQQATAALVRWNSSATAGSPTEAVAQQAEQQPHAQLEQHLPPLPQQLSTRTDALRSRRKRRSRVAVPAPEEQALAQPHSQPLGASDLTAGIRAADLKAWQPPEASTPEQTSASSPGHAPGNAMSQQLAPHPEAEQSQASASPLAGQAAADSPKAATPSAQGKQEIHQQPQELKQGKEQLKQQHRALCQQKERLGQQWQELQLQRERLGQQQKELEKDQQEQLGQQWHELQQQKRLLGQQQLEVQQQKGTLKQQLRELQELPRQQKMLQKQLEQEQQPAEAPTSSDAAGASQATHLKSALKQVQQQIVLLGQQQKELHEKQQKQLGHQQRQLLGQQWQDLEQQKRLLGQQQQELQQLLQQQKKLQKQQKQQPAEAHTPSDAADASQATHLQSAFAQVQQQEELQGQQQQQQQQQQPEAVPTSSGAAHTNQAPHLQSASAQLQQQLSALSQLQVQAKQRQQQQQQEQQQQDMEQPAAAAELTQVDAAKQAKPAREEQQQQGQQQQKSGGGKRMADESVPGQQQQQQHNAARQLARAKRMASTWVEKKSGESVSVIELSSTELMDRGIDPLLLEPSISRALLRFFARSYVLSPQLLWELSKAKDTTAPKILSNHFHAWLLHHAPAMPSPSHNRPTLMILSQSRNSHNSSTPPSSRPPLPDQTAPLPAPPSEQSTSSSRPSSAPPPSAEEPSATAPSAATPATAPEPTPSTAEEPSATAPSAATPAAASEPTPFIAEETPATAPSAATPAAACEPTPSNESGIRAGPSAASALESPHSSSGTGHAHPIPHQGTDQSAIRAGEQEPTNPQRQEPDQAASTPEIGPDHHPHTSTQHAQILEQEQQHAAALEEEERLTAQMMEALLGEAPQPIRQEHATPPPTDAQPPPSTQQPPPPAAQSRKAAAKQGFDAHLHATFPSLSPQATEAAKSAKHPTQLPPPIPPAEPHIHYAHRVRRTLEKLLSGTPLHKAIKRSTVSDFVSEPLEQRVKDEVVPAWARALAAGRRTGFLESVDVDRQMAGPTARSPQFWAWLQGELQRFWPALQVLAGYKHLGPLTQSEAVDLDQSGPAAAVFPLLDASFLRWLQAKPQEFQEVAARQLSLERTHLGPPTLWYPLARSIGRKFVYHAGPTNSGKTFSAMQALSAARSGVYCGPLRLLAIEAHEKLNQAGVPCKLLTGDEVRPCPYAQHAACTVEMAPVSVGYEEGKVYDTAVLDEIQMLGDQQRGWAWTRAVLGVAAREVHVCGDASALPLLKAICKQNGEPLEVRKYERSTPLQLDVPDDLAGRMDFGNFIQPGDALIFFSRKDIFQWRAALEARGHKCCLIYGALPAETRREQAKLFNDPNSGYDVLLATDAIGMGLNLNIRRIVFTSMTKPRGPVQQSLGISTQLTDTEIKQIAGRAGRRGSRYEQGFTSYFNFNMLPRKVNRVRETLKKALLSKLPALEVAYVKPEAQQVEALAAVMPGTPLSELLQRFERKDIFVSRSEWESVMAQEGVDISAHSDAKASEGDQEKQATPQPKLKRKQRILQRQEVQRLKQLEKAEQKKRRQQGAIFEPVPSDHDATVADILEYFPQLTMAERLKFAESPVQIRLPDNKPSKRSSSQVLPGQKNTSLVLVGYLREYAAIMANGGLVHHPHFPLDWLLLHVGDPVARLQMLEVWHQALSLWIWLAYRMGSHRFPGIESAGAHMARVVELLGQSMHDCFSQESMLHSGFRLPGVGMQPAVPDVASSGAHPCAYTGTDSGRGGEGIEIGGGGIGEAQLGTETVQGFGDGDGSESESEDSESESESESSDSESDSESDIEEGEESMGAAGEHERGVAVMVPADMGNEALENEQEDEEPSSQQQQQQSSAGLDHGELPHSTSANASEAACDGAFAGHHAPHTANAPGTAAEPAASSSSTHTHVDGTHSHAFPPDPHSHPTHSHSHSTGSKHRQHTDHTHSHVAPSSDPESLAKEACAPYVVIDGMRVPVLLPAPQQTLSTEGQEGIPVMLRMYNELVSAWIRPTSSPPLPNRYFPTTHHPSTSSLGASHQQHLAQKQPAKVAAAVSSSMSSSHRARGGRESSLVERTLKSVLGVLNARRRFDRE